MKIVNRIVKWFRIHYQNVVKSIAFVPAIISISFLALSFLMLVLDRSEMGKNMKSAITWLSLKDASTARDITGTITTGMISLLVFSFSTVLIVLNQAASKMSNRLLSGMIENRFQQIVLGFYVGTIVYSLFLLSTIRDLEEGIYVPALSIYLLMFFTIVDIFLFIYFLHYVTQSVKYETIIRQLRLETLGGMKEHYCNSVPESMTISDNFDFLYAPQSGYLQGGNRNELMDFCRKNNCFLELLVPQGEFILKGNPLMKIKTDAPLTEEDQKNLLFFFDFYTGHPVEKNPVNGFRRLKEVAVSAYQGLSDPGTTELCIHGLSDLLGYRLFHKPESVLRDEDGIARISIPTITFGDLLFDSFMPIVDRARQDRFIMSTMNYVLQQLNYKASRPEDKQAISRLIREVEGALARIREKDETG